MAANSAPIVGGAGSAFSDPISSPASWDTINLAGVQTNVISHGLLKAVTGFHRDNGYQEKKGRGTEGATITYVQRPPAKGKVHFTCWTSVHFRTWGQFRSMFTQAPVPGTPLTAISVSYPSLDDLQISSAVVKKISPWIRGPKGRWDLEIELWEFYPTVQTVSAAQTITLTSPNPPSTMPAVGAVPQTATQKLKAAIAALQSQRQSP